MKGGVNKPFEPKKGKMAFNSAKNTKTNIFGRESPKVMLFPANEIALLRLRRPDTFYSLSCK